MDESIELKAINSAYSSQVELLYLNLIENMQASKIDDGPARFLAGLRLLRLARDQAIKLCQG